MRYLFFICLFIQYQCAIDKGTQAFSDQTKRIVFLGNSITYHGKYIEYIEAHFLTQYPRRNYEFINVGLPSETVSGLSEENHAGGAFPRPDLRERLDRVLSHTNPDLVFSCYGMNDGIYLPLDQGRFNKYKEGIEWLNTSVTQTGASLIHITPPVFDKPLEISYAHVLDTYSDWLLSKRQTEDWRVIDIHWPMQKELNYQRQSDSTFMFTTDGVHPTDHGHFFISKHILLALGESSMNDISDEQSFLDDHESKDSLLYLVNKKQTLMKDSWLSTIGHIRPRMTTGLPMEEAIKKLNLIEKKIEELRN